MEKYFNNIKQKYYNQIDSVLNQNIVKVKKDIKIKNFIQLYIDTLYYIKFLYNGKEIGFNYPEIFLLIDLDTNKKYVLFKNIQQYYYEIP